MIELLASNDAHACVLVSDIVRPVAADTYFSAGIKPVDAERAVIVNLTVKPLQIADLIFAKTQAYDFQTKLRIQSKEAGDTIDVVAHPHAHWKTRLQNFVDLVLEDDADAYIAFLDMPPSDEMNAAPVDVRTLISNPKKLLIMVQDDTYRMLHTEGSVKKMRTDFNSVVQTLVTHKEAFFAISPPGAWAKPLTYANVIFGSCKRPRTQPGLILDVVIKVPKALRYDGTALIEHNDLVVHASFGASSHSLMLKVCVPTTPEQRWQVALLQAKHASAPFEDVVDRTTPILAQIVRQIRATRAAHAGNSLVDLVKNTFDMMLETPNVHKTLAQHPLLMKMWINTIHLGEVAWSDARSSIDMCGPIMRRINDRDALRGHSMA